MLIIIAVFILLASSRIGNLNFTLINDWLLQLQGLCSQGYQLSNHHEILSAMVCGQSPQAQQVVTDWGVTGLLPILIGAGTHFIFLEQILNRLLRRHPFLKGTSLFLFVCVTGFSAALTRGLVAQVLSDLNFKWKLGFGFPRIWLMSLVICLVFCPQWLTSLGFLISAQCGLLMFICFQMRTELATPSAQRLDFKGRVLKAVRFSILRITVFMIGLMPLFRILGLPRLHPSAMLIQLLGIPIAGLVLFPLGVLERIVRPLQPFFDPFWNRVVWLIHHLAQQIAGHDGSLFRGPPAFQFASGAGPFWAWSYIGSYFALIYILDLRRRSGSRLQLMNDVSIWNAHSKSARGLKQKKFIQS